MRTKRTAPNQFERHQVQQVAFARTKHPARPIKSNESVMFAVRFLPDVL